MAQTLDLRCLIGSQCGRWGLLNCELKFNMVCQASRYWITDYSVRDNSHTCELYRVLPSVVDSLQSIINFTVPIHLPPCLTILFSPTAGLVGAIRWICHTVVSCFGTCLTKMNECRAIIAFVVIKRELEVPKYKKERFHFSELMVAFGITAKVVGRAWWFWYREKAAC